MPGREAVLFQTMAAGRVRCNVCYWRCAIPDRAFGVCRMRQARDGRIVLHNYPGVASACADPIEKKPLFHFHPGSRVFSLGSWGCNFHCLHCQNWELSAAEAAEAGRRSHALSPREAVELALASGSQGMAWTYNEPSIWLEYAFDCAVLARDAGLYTVFVTNGFSTPEALDLLGPWLDAYRVDVKGFSDALYSGLAKVHRWRSILESAAYAKHRWDMHVEIVTNLVPTLNDDEAQLQGIARWIREELGAATPWHLTAFHPDHRLRHLPPTPVATIERAMAVGREEGLFFLYAGNVWGHDSESTRCPGCGAVAVRRSGYRTEARGLTGDGRCAACGFDLNIRTPEYHRLPAAARVQSQ